MDRLAAVDQDVSVRDDLPGGPDSAGQAGAAHNVVEAALEEHAEWILMHRERAIDQKDAARLG